MRSLRAVVLAGSSVLLGALAHSNAEASQVGPGSVLAFSSVLALSWVATARQVTWPVIALILAGGQALTHAALAAGHAGGSHAHDTGAVGLPVVAPVDGRMIALHAGAWLVLTLLFTVGERALWRSVDRLCTPWVVPVTPLPRPRLVAFAPREAVPALAHHQVRGRAPPLG